MKKTAKAAVHLHCLRARLRHLYCHTHNIHCHTFPWMFLQHYADQGNKLCLVITYSNSNPTPKMWAFHSEKITQLCLLKSEE